MGNYVKLWMGKSLARAWGWGDALSGLAGSAIPIAAHFFPAWGEKVSDSLWMVPIWGLAAAALFRLLITPYELWRGERQRADIAECAMRAIGQHRPLRALTVLPMLTVDASGVGSVTALRFSHENIGPLLLRFTLGNMWIEWEGQRMVVPDAGQAHFAQPSSSSVVDCQLPTPIRISTFPGRIDVNFDYAYDSVPPLHPRKTGGTVWFIMTGDQVGSPVEGSWIRESREE